MDKVLLGRPYSSYFPIIPVGRPLEKYSNTVMIHTNRKHLFIAEFEREWKDFLGSIRNSYNGLGKNGSDEYIFN
jgi:hypothetical protein